MHTGLAGALEGRTGHFKLESGHHGDLWFDLERLCLRPGPIGRMAAELSTQLPPFGVEAVCGPLVEGAFVALMVASSLEVEFYYAERFAPAQSDVLYPVEYRIPKTLRSNLPGKRVAIMNDVTSAGSAVRGTLADLEACGAQIVVIASLLVLGDSISSFAADRAVPLVSVATLPYNLWTPSSCPLCASGVPLERLAEPS